MRLWVRHIFCWSILTQLWYLFSHFVLFIPSELNHWNQWIDGYEPGICFVDPYWPSFETSELNHWNQWIDDCESGTYFVGPYWPSFNPSSPRLGYRAFMIKVWSFRVESLESMDRWLWVRHIFCWSILTQLWDFRVESLESMVRSITCWLIHIDWLHLV